MLNRAEEISDPRMRSYLVPSRVLWHTMGEAAPLDAAHLTYPGSRTTSLVHKGEAPALLLDFGREINGGIAIRRKGTWEQKPVRVRVRFGESASEAMAEPNQDHAIHDSELLVPWFGTAEFGNTGFRFVRIDLVEEGATLDLEWVRAIFRRRDLAYKGRFDCSDPRLNSIWETGAYTVHLCMQDYVYDGIKRDRLVWIGDIHPELMVVNTVFGAEPSVPASLDKLRDETPLPNWMNGISSYSLWWIIAHRDWFQYHGNEPYLAEQHEYLTALLREVMKHIGPNGREQLPGHRFLDWPTSEDPKAIHAGLQGLASMALQAGAQLCHVLREDELQHECLATANAMHAHTPPATSSKQANALLAIAGLADVQQVNQKVLGNDPLQGLSTFYGYYVLQARALAGDYAGCLEVIRNYWGAMLDYGATSFWEHFELDWTRNAGRIDELPRPDRDDLHADFGDYCYVGHRHSLCHGWAAGPTAWMTEHILGLRPLKPGCAVVQVQPHLAGLEFAEGALPTPHGMIEVRHEAQPGGLVKTEISAPDEVRIVQGPGGGTA